MKTLQLTNLTYLPNPNDGYYTAFLQTDDTGHFELRIEICDLLGKFSEVIYHPLPPGIHHIHDALSYATILGTTNIFNTGAKQ